MVTSFPRQALFETNVREHRFGLGTAELDEIVDGYGEVDRASLIHQLALHLPRFSPEESADPAIIVGEAIRLAARLQDLRYPVRGFLPARAGVEVRLCDLRFEPVPDVVAQPILERFHYLLSFRPGSRHFGLKLPNDEQWPVAMVTLSPFDLSNVLPGLEACNVRPTEVVVLSRVFAFPQAPPNAISYMLAKVRHELGRVSRKRPAMLTYVNPNLGFLGASYRADNWILLGEEQDTRYLYYQGNYITDRKALRLFGPSFDTLISSEGSLCLTRSRCSLHPLQVFLRAPALAPMSRELLFEKWSDNHGASSGVGIFSPTVCE